MSIHIQSLVWFVNFPAPSQKLLALRFADFAGEDGGSIFPSIDRVADQIGVSRRQTKYAIKALESCGLITKIESGGAGAGDTNEWKFDVDLLVSLALQEIKLSGVHDSLELVENKGANIAPRDLLRVQSIALRGQLATNKGATHSPRLFINPQLEPSNAREGGKPETEPVEKKPKPKPAKPAISIEKDGPGWADWLSLIEKERPELVDTANTNGTITAHSRFPKEDGLQGLVSVGEKIKPLPRDYTARLLGEGEGE